MKLFLALILVAWVVSSALSIATIEVFDLHGFGPGFLLGLGYGCVCQALVWTVARP